VQIVKYYPCNQNLSGSLYADFRKKTSGLNH